MNAVVVAGLIVANIVGSLIVLGRVVQRSERSRFRYETWRARDELVDAVMAGRVQPRKQVLELIDRLEVTIDATDLMTPYRLLTAVRTLRRAGWRPPDERPDYAATPEEEKIIDAVRDRASHARGRLFFCGSPSGWLLLSLSPLLALAILLTERHGERRTRPPQTVAEWSRDHYGPPSEIVRPLVRPKDNRAKRSLGRSRHVPSHAYG